MITKTITDIAGLLNPTTGIETKKLQFWTNLNHAEKLYSLEIKTKQLSNYVTELCCFYKKSFIFYYNVMKIKYWYSCNIPAKGKLNVYMFPILPQWRQNKNHMAQIYLFMLEGYRYLLISYKKYC